MRPEHELAEVLRLHRKQVENHPKINSCQLRTLSAIKLCRTSGLGGHVDACTECGNTRISYNSCRNRHCPKCQGKNREKWLADREAELLPVPYFHVVFTLPDTLNPLAMYQPKAVEEYLGRYTHKVAISNHRILAIDSKQITFSYKDYRKGAQ